MKSILSWFLALFILQFIGPIQAQHKLNVYDGTVGIGYFKIENDTLDVFGVLESGPAYRAGIRRHDKIVRINDSLVAGVGITRRDIQQYLFGMSGEELKVTVKREGVDSLMSFIFQRDPVMSMKDSHDYEYLVDSTGCLSIQDILSDSIHRQFTSVSETSIQVHSVDKGSPAEKMGLLPGDQLTYMTEEAIQGYYSLDQHLFHIPSGDSSLTILRDSVEIRLSVDSRVSDLEGALSQFRHDFNQNVIWLKLNTVSNISVNRTYLFQMVSAGWIDTLSFFELSPSGDIIERMTGNNLPPADRDFVFRGWKAVKVNMETGSEKCCYFRISTANTIDPPSIRLIAYDTLVRYDKVERIILSSFGGMILLIFFYYLIMFFATRRRYYLFYSLFILSIGYLLISLVGYTGEFFHGKLLDFVISSEDAVFAATAAFFLLFGISYLDLRLSLKGWYKVVLINLLLILVSTIFFVLRTEVFVQDEIGTVSLVAILLYLLSVLVLPFIILLWPAITRIRKGFKPAWYFLVANIVLIPTVIVSVSATDITSGSVDQSDVAMAFSKAGIFIGTVVQFLIFSMGLAQKIRLDEKEKKLAQERIIKQLKENEQLKDKVNRELEEKVKERTKEIREQKEEIEARRDEIEVQKEEIEAQRDEIEAQRDQLVVHRDQLVMQKQKITASIAYAQHIQSAVLPHREYMNTVMPEYFVLFKPRDVVSGDFYWIKEVKNKLVVVVADCTGHGIPGAFMSMLGITLLNEQVASGRYDNPGEILGSLRTKVKEMLVQEGRMEEQKDGMDMAIVILDKMNKELKFAGAYNPLYLVRQRDHIEGDELASPGSVENANRILFELKGDMQPIGIHAIETDFTTHTLELKEEDTFYIFSDGFVDQFGGTNRKKFKTPGFKKLLLSIQDKSMKDQREDLDASFELWRGKYEQIDDVCVIGVRI